MCLGKENLSGMMYVLADNHIKKFNDEILQPEGHETHSTHKSWAGNSVKSVT